MQFFSHDCVICTILLFHRQLLCRHVLQDSLLGSYSSALSFNRSENVWTSVFRFQRTRLTITFFPAPVPLNSAISTDSSGISSQNSSSSLFQHHSECLGRNLVDCWNCQNFAKQKKCTHQIQKHQEQCQTRGKLVNAGAC